MADTDTLIETGREALETGDWAAARDAFEAAARRATRRPRRCSASRDALWWLEDIEGRRSAGASARTPRCAARAILRRSGQRSR